MYLLVLFFASLAHGCLSASPLVTVAGVGELRGDTSQFSRDVFVFKGIPYAKPPTKDLRWRPPQPYGHWQGIRDATVFGNSCFGLYPSASITNQSEDCLFLNVATPAIAVERDMGLPVMVYIHGGGYSGGASNHNYPDSLVAHSNHSVLVVTLNYRLNVFGFLGSTTLQARSDDKSFGNYGIQDQRLALAWIRDHIHAFGGQGDAITIFGQSAGGNAVLHHLVQPASFHLYSKAIIESGNYRGTLTLAEAEAAFQAVLNSTSCDSLACLLHVSARRLVDAASAWAFVKPWCPWGPVIDGVSLDSFPLKLLESGAHNRVPILMGSNRDEGSVWVADEHGQFGLSPTASELDLQIFASKHFGFLDQSDLQKLRGIYSPNVYEYPTDRGNASQPWWSAVGMITDGGSLGPSSALGHCSVRRAARAIMQHGSKDVFVYVFAHASEERVYDLNLGTPVPGTGRGSPLVPHASELFYVFGLLASLGSKGETALARSMSSYWTQFARSGNPNRPGLQRWPRYDTDNDDIIELAIPPGAKKRRHMLRDLACHFWDEQLAVASAYDLVV